MKKADQCAGSSGADQWAHDGDGSVGPIRVTLAGDGENKVSDARAKVARGIDRVSRGAAERETDGPNENADEIRSDARGHRADGFGGHGDGNEHEDKGADDFGDKVSESVADSGGGAEDAELEIGVSGLFPVREILEPDENGSTDGPEELRGDIEGEF